MITRAEIAAEALEWVGTPFRGWGQVIKHKACDCVGIIYGVARELNLKEAELAAAHWQQYRKPNSDLLLDGLRASMIQTDHPQIGDVLVQNAGYPPKPLHVALLVDEKNIVHCYGRNIDCVVKVRLGKSRPIHSWWTWPSLEKN